MPAYPRPPEQRFFEKITKDPESGCWLWNLRRATRGYGMIIVEGKRVGVHRWSYQYHVGPIPDGQLIDHACRNSRCVNPDHLRLADRKRNAENTVVRSTNKSGYTGVCAYRNGKWRAYVVHNWKQIHLGIFATPEEAAEVARLKRLELFTYNEADR